MKTSHEAYYSNFSGIQDVPNKNPMLYESAVQHRATSSNILKIGPAPLVGQP